MGRLVLIAALLAIGCEKRPAPVPPRPADLLRARPYITRAPAGYRAHGPAPLVIVLCGYDATGEVCDDFFGFNELSGTESFVDVVLDGTVDVANHHFWNATDACCNKYGATVDDVAYVGAVLDDVMRKESIDPHRVFVFGFSNGGFFAHRLACELSDRIAAVASMAGATWSDPARCTPSSPVSLLEIHGDADEVVPFPGGRIPFDAGVPPGVLPGARATVGFWAQRDRCTSPLERVGERNLDMKLPGAETTVERFGACPDGSGVELWTVHGGTHLPNDNHFGKAVYQFFAAHPKR